MTSGPTAHQHRIATPVQVTARRPSRARSLEPGPTTATRVRPDPIAFLSNEDGRIDFLENVRGIPLTPELARALAEHAAAGRQIRILTNSPTRRLEPLFGYEHVEIRFIEYLEHSLLRAGDAMLLALIMDYEADQPPPLLDSSGPSTAGSSTGSLTTSTRSPRTPRTPSPPTSNSIATAPTTATTKQTRTTRTGPSSQNRPANPPSNRQAPPDRALKSAHSSRASRPNAAGHDAQTDAGGPRRIGEAPLPRHGRDCGAGGRAVKVGPSARASRAPDGAPLTAHPPARCSAQVVAGEGLARGRSWPRSDASPMVSSGRSRGALREARGQATAYGSSSAGYRNRSDLTRQAASAWPPSAK